MCACAYVQACLQAYLQTYVQTYVQMYVRAGVRASVWASERNWHSGEHVDLHTGSNPRLNRKP